MKSGKLDLLHIMHEQFLFTKAKHTIMTIHGLGPLLYPDLYTQNYCSKWLYSLHNGLEKASVIITVSESIKHHLIHYYPKWSHKYKTTFLGISNNFILTKDPEIQKRYLKSLNIDFPFILYVGAADPGKNLINLLKSFSLLLTKNPELPYHLIMAGNPTWGGYHQLQSKIEELGLNNRIHFIGYIDQANLPYLYGSSELFFFPALFEGFGLPVLEAMASGAPCLVSNRPALTEVGSDIVEYCDPESVKDMAKKLETLLGNPEKLSIIRAKGQEYARQFTWDRTAKETIRIYEDVLGTRLT